MKVVAHCAVWILAFCAVLISPVILIFGVPLAIGIGADVIDAGAGPLGAVLIASTLACLTIKGPMRASAKALFRSAAPHRHAKQLVAAAAARQAAKSIS
jgi:hypothetical protein